VIPGGTVTAHAELAQRLRGAGALAVTKLDHVEGLVGEAFAGRQPGADHKILVVTDRAMARADLPTGLEDVRAVAVMARKAALCGPVLVEDFLPQLLLAGSRDIADRLESRVFAPLAEYQADELAATLKTLVANNFDRAATAAALPAHRNTVLYRVNRIEKITGLDLSRSRDLAMIWLATTWRDLSR
jgi:sugar diacid utilization regulator